GEIEVPRADLARILCAAARDDAEFVYDDTVTRLNQDPGGVDVTFERGPGRRFDLVVGADGLHSAVRRLAFGPDRDFMRHLGVYVATTPLGEPPEQPHDVLPSWSVWRAVLLGDAAASVSLFGDGSSMAIA